MTTARVTADFTTDAGAVEASFPLYVTCPFTPTSVRVVQAEPVPLDPTVPRYESVQVARWSASGRQLTISYLTGLDVGTRYVVVLEVSDA